MRSNIGAAPGLPRTPFNSPPLLRLLAGLAAEAEATPAPAAAEPRASLAERLSQWLDWTEAITLSAALNSSPVPSQPGAGPAAAQAAADALAAVRSDLARAIRSNSAFTTASDDDGSDFAPWRRACQAQQRAMAAAISRLRARLRMALAAASPALAQLAAMDAALDAALREREQHLLGAVPRRLEQRHRRLRQAGQAGWLALFQQDLQRCLLAELDLRLQPAQGLVDALAQASAASA